MPTTVPPIGPTDAKIVLLGEAPGAEEVRYGVPFVGASGQLLDSLLGRVGIDRAQCYITNVVKERPPGNDIERFISFPDKKSPVPTPKFEAYHRELMEELGKLSPNLIIPLGKVAMYALLGDARITERRGSLYWHDGLGCKVMPTYHPASALPGRNPLYSYIMHMDLARARSESRTPELNLPKRSLIKNPTLEEVLKYLDYAKGKSHVGFDIESSITRVKGNKHTREMIMFSLALAPDMSMAVPLTWENGTSLYAPESELKILRSLGELLEHPSTVKIGQNLMYDASVLYHRYGMKLWPLEDTMLAHHLLAPKLPKDLGFLTSMYTREPYFKDTGGKYFSEGEVDWDDFQRYSALDSAVVLDIWPRLERDLRKMENWDIYRETVDIYPILIQMQEMGFRMNEEGLKARAKEIRGEIRTMQKELDALWLETKRTKDPQWAEKVQEIEEKIAAAKEKGRTHKGHSENLKKLLTLNVKSTPQKREFFYSKTKGLGAKPVIKQKKQSTDADAIKKLVANGVPGARLVQDITINRDNLSKYWTVKLDFDGRLRGSFKPAGTATGRLSSEKSQFGTGAQLQNIPKRMKAFMLADPDHFLVEMDLGQAENRIVAALAEDDEMKHAFETDVSVHSLTGSKIATIYTGKPHTWQEVEAQDKEEVCAPLGDGSHPWRFWGKKANHALNYGMGPMLAALEFEVPVRDAKFIINAYHKAYPGVTGVFWALVEHALQGDRKLTNLLGRTIFIMGPLNDDLRKFGYSYIPQSTVPGIINGRGLRYIKPYGEGILLPCNQVHDSLWLQVHRGNIVPALAAMRKLKTSLETPLKWKDYEFTIPVDTKIGPNCEALTEINLLDTDEVNARIINERIAV